MATDPQATPASAMPASPVTLRDHPTPGAANQLVA